MMLAVALCFIYQTGRNVPFHEDWVMVRPLTGQEPHFLKWLWTQNNEHRNPLPRLMLLGLLKLTHGDFRVGMVFNALTLAGVAAAMIIVARRLRGGRTELMDAFFPLLFLHLGHSENLGMMSWQVAFVFPTLLVLMVLLALVSSPMVERSVPALLLGTTLVLLPLSGANGLLFVPLLALWCGYCGVRLGFHSRSGHGHRWTMVMLLGAAVMALTLFAIYFVGYRPAVSTGVNPSFLQKLTTSGEILVLGMGPGIARFGWLSWVAILALLGATVGLLLQVVLRQRGVERHRASAMLLFLGNCILATFATGWGRAAQKLQWGSLPIRYVVLGLPLFCLIFFAWELYGSAKVRRPLQMALLALMCLLLPFNIKSGLRYQQVYREGMRALEQDIRAGKSSLELAQAHGSFVIGWWKTEALAQQIQMLQAAGMSDFAKAGPASKQK